MKPRTYITIKGKKTLLTKKLAWELCLKHWNRWKRRKYDSPKEDCLPYKIENISNNCFFCAYAGQRSGTAKIDICKKYCPGCKADNYEGNNQLWCEQDDIHWAWESGKFHTNLKRLAKKEGYLK